MLKRLRWPQIIITTFFIAIILFGASYFIVKQSLAVMQDNEQPSSDITNNDNQVDDPIKNSEESAISGYPGLQLRIETEEATRYTTSISIPVTESDLLNEPIEQWITAQKQQFDDLVNAENLQISEDNRAHLNIQLETEKITEHIYSLLMKSYSYTGGANGETSLKAITIDIKNEQIVSLDDVFDVNEQSLAMIRSYVTETLLKDDKLNLYIIEEMLEKELANEEEWEWCFNSKEMTLHFPQYEIAAGAAGNITVVVPIEKLRPYLKDSIAEAVNMPKLPEEKPVEQEPKEEERELSPDDKYVVLTFDDGPSDKVTPRILETLKKYDAKATFFMLGSQVEYHPEIAKQVADEGHELANHSYWHPDLTKFSYEKAMKELVQTNEVITAATGKQSQLVRPPYGAIDNNVKSIARNNDLVIALWSVDTLDWQNRNPNKINQIVARDVRPGSVILMHDIHSTTADALPKMLASLQNDGYKFITMSELLSLEKGISKNGQVFVK